MAIAVHQALGFSFAPSSINHRPAALNNYSKLYSSPTDVDAPAAVEEEDAFEGDDDAIIQIKPSAMA
eukprot:scaffold26506_cov78-Skeletonema_dohrnii-CCMP3373.AAC.1